MGSINKQISRFDTTAVYTHPDAHVDIVLVHGLNGEPYKTWASKNGVFWPSDLLPETLRGARANVLVYGYNADVYSKKHGGGPSDNYIYMHAQNLVTGLTHYRKDELSSRNPIIWVCHSLGGILVKRALLYSNDLRASHHEDYRQIYVSTFGIIFLGTPHTGSDMGGWATTLQSMSDAVVPKAFWQSESVLLKTLKKDNETLQNINNHFLDIYQRFRILMAHENQKTDLKGTKMLVVDAQSASPQLPGVAYYAIEATHSGMCKFESRNAPGYRVISTAIRDWVGEAPDVISTRWRVEDDEKLARAKHEIEERMKPWIKSQAVQQALECQSRSSAATSPPTNSASKDAQRMLHGSGSSGILLPFEIEEIEAIDDPKLSLKLPSTSKPLLLDSQSTEQGGDLSSQESTSDAPSREPIFVKPNVFRPNTHFKGRDKEMKELHKKLMERERRSKGTSSVLIQSMPGGGKTHLARQYVFEHRYDYPGGLFWIRAKTQQEIDYGYWDIAKTLALKETEHLSTDGLNESKKMVRAVVTWLSNTEHWLLVLDGVHFDIPDLQDYIPFAKHTSIIYTSTERTTGEDYQFDNPQVILLDSLTAHEAQELLLEEMEKKKPYNQDDLSRALELVQLMERLPLMIHVAARHLKATREPLSKYLRSYRNRPKAGNLPAYRAVREQLQHRGNIAALNLMSILAFFSQHIPVEMLVLGLRGLDKRTPVKSADVETRKPLLNNTFKILIAFALLERNENTQTLSSSDTSSRSVDMAQDCLDILRIHGIVQAFFVDVLAEEKQAPFWLERAVCVFCRAFDESDKRIEEDNGTGMPEDYLRFQIHGNKLMTYLDRFEKKAPALAECRDMLESRMDSIRERIEQLTKRKRAKEQGSKEAPITSVFERSNSLSESNSDTLPSNGSVIEWRLGDSPPLQSPAIYNPSDYNPYHWHISYPHCVRYPDEGDISRTITPQPAPTEIFESISVPDDYVPRGSIAASHRTIKRNAERRYRDHAGSWRADPQILSDPRVSLSREAVRGFISAPATRDQSGDRSRSTSSHRLTASSDAEMTLNRITKVSPPPPRSGGNITDHSRTSSTSSMRPKLIAGRTSYTTTAYTETAIEDDYPVTPTFVNVMGTSPPSSLSYAAETMLRLKQNEKPVTMDGLAPSKFSSPLSADPLTTASLNTSAHTTQHPIPDESPEHISSPPSQPPSRTGHRRTRSSPGQYAGPFPPPSIPVEVNTHSSLRPLSNASGARHLDTQGQEVEGATHEEGHEHLANSLPSIRPQPTLYPHTMPVRPRPLVAVHPAPWTASDVRLDHHLQGYTSQPMSRDPSHQSSRSQASARTQHSGPSRNGSLLTGSGNCGSPALSQVMQHPCSRRPSLVETEPSPRLEGFPDLETPETSYHMYNKDHRGQRRASSGDGDGVYPGARSRSGFFSRFNGKKGKGRGARGAAKYRRAENAVEQLGKASSRGSPGLSEAGPSGAADIPRSGSGSGGIILGNGTIVEFGSSPPTDEELLSTGGRVKGQCDDVGLGIME